MVGLLLTLGTFLLPPPHSPTTPWSALAAVPLQLSGQHIKKHVSEIEKLCIKSIMLML